MKGKEVVSLLVPQSCRNREEWKVGEGGGEGASSRSSRLGKQGH